MAEKQGVNMYNILHTHTDENYFRQSVNICCLIFLSVPPYLSIFNFRVDFHGA